MFLILLFCFWKFFLAAMAQPPTTYVLPEQFDETIEKQHQSYLSVVCSTVLGTVHSHTYTSTPDITPAVDSQVPNTIHY
jgi:hypothetical protein